MEITVKRREWSKSPRIVITPTSRGTWTVEARYYPDSYPNWRTEQTRYWRGITTLEALKTAQAEAFAFAYSGATS